MSKLSEGLIYSRAGSLQAKNLSGHPKEPARVQGRFQGAPDLEVSCPLIRLVLEAFGSDRAFVASIEGPSPHALGNKRGVPMV